VSFTPIAIGARLYLSEACRESGGPYGGASALLCVARASERGAVSTRILPGLEATIGTEIPLSSVLAIDWNASYIITSNLRGFAPDVATHATDREGLRRGVIRIRLILRR
jgi:hypothetical protein